MKDEDLLFIVFMSTIGSLIMFLMYLLEIISIEVTFFYTMLIFICIILIGAIRIVYGELK